MFEIICPCSKKELGQLIDFVIHGKFQCEDEIDSSKVFDNLTKILGFPSDLDYQRRSKEAKVTRFTDG